MVRVVRAFCPWDVVVVGERFAGLWLVWICREHCQYVVYMVSVFTQSGRLNPESMNLASLADKFNHPPHCYPPPDTTAIPVCTPDSQRLLPRNRTLHQGYMLVHNKNVYYIVARMCRSPIEGSNLLHLFFTKFHVCRRHREDVAISICLHLLFYASSATA